MKKIAIVGASYLQAPLIKKAKEMELETHVFAWAANDVGEKVADFFYPISIVEKDAILAKCCEIGIDGICTIASDLAVITVNYVAEKMGLIGNGMEATMVSTNKKLMRSAFEKNGDPSPKSILVENSEDINEIDISYPVIAKPLDRSGSRGITKVNEKKDLKNAIDRAIDQGFIKKALVEEFIEGQEYSVEYISYKGLHTFLTLTKKYTTGSPGFIETAHLEPAEVTDPILKKVKCIVEHALDTLGIKNGASHSEIKISGNGDIKIVEIGGRMGGDFIGSSLVELSTGVDFVKAVIDVSLGIAPTLEFKEVNTASAVRFVFNEHDISVLEEIRANHSDMLVNYEYDEHVGESVNDSSERHGYYILSADKPAILEEYLTK